MHGARGRRRATTAAVVLRRCAVRSAIVELAGHRTRTGGEAQYGRDAGNSPDRCGDRQRPGDDPSGARPPRGGARARAQVRRPGAAQRRPARRRRRRRGRGADPAWPAARGRRKCAGSAAPHRLLIRALRLPARPEEAPGDPALRARARIPELGRARRPSVDEEGCFSPSPASADPSAGARAAVRMRGRSPSGTPSPATPS